MVKYNILIKPSAVKEIENIPKEVRLRIIQRFKDWQITPNSRDVKSLQEKTGTESVRESTE